MKKEAKPILYKIYYEIPGQNHNLLVYLGRTKQPLQDRLRGHFFKKPMHRVIDINLVARIEYAEFKTVADMYLYEIYYINRLKPSLNVDDLARDEITVTLPEIEFVEYDCPLLEKWRAEINLKTAGFEKLCDELREIPQQISLLRKRYRNQELTEEEYWTERDAISQREKELYFQIYGYEK